MREIIIKSYFVIFSRSFFCKSFIRNCYIVKVIFNHCFVSWIIFDIYIIKVFV